jgi:hypothetical protein
MELIFHIGTPKAASTRIQAFCFKNREILKKYGISY